MVVIFFGASKYSTSVYASDQLFYLDTVFQNPLAQMTYHQYHGQTFLQLQSAACPDGTNNASIFFIADQIDARVSFVNVYDTTTQVCSTSSDSKGFSTRRTRSNVLRVVLNGRIYIYSGVSNYLNTITAY
ncbi:12546_t:CDS:1 [Gigaspora rosea]|nr:12546_t:CDS:1 [Gigaspora rosea]